MNNPLVVCALKDEFSIKGSNYDLLYTGVGKVNATIHLTEYLLKKGRPEYIVNYGTAGSKKVKVGSLVDCTKFVQRDMDVSGLGFEKYETPFEDDISKKIDFSSGIPEKIEGETKKINYEKTPPLNNELKYFLEHLGGRKLSLANMYDGYDTVRILVEAGKKLVK